MSISQSIKCLWRCDFWIPRSLLKLYNDTGLIILKLLDIVPFFVEP